MPKMWCGLALVAGLIGAALPAAAQHYPDHTIRVVVPQTPGGATDVFARALAQKLTDRWGKPVVVDNRAGAGGIIGTDVVAKSAPDGYTLLFTYAGSQAINQSLYAKVPFDSVNDFQMVATFAVVPFFLVAHPGLPAKTLPEFIALARAKPGDVRYASSGNGSINHLLAAMLASDAKIDILHVPYKGIAPALTDVIAGQVESAFASVPSVIQHVQSGALRAIAISSPGRNGAAPDVPAIAETIPGFDVNPWWGLLAPARTPDAIVQKLNAEVADILKTEDMRAFLKTQGADPLISTPAAFKAQLEADIVLWAKVVKASGAKID